MIKRHNEVINNIQQLTHNYNEIVEEIHQNILQIKSFKNYKVINIDTQKVHAVYEDHPYSSSIISRLTDSNSDNNNNNVTPKTSTNRVTTQGVNINTRNTSIVKK